MFLTEELSETCSVSYQNKFVKLVHLVGFIIKKVPLILNPDTRQMSVVKFTDQPFYPKEKASQIHLVGPTAHVDMVENRKISWPWWESDSKPSSRQHVPESVTYICALCYVPCLSMNISCLAFSLNVYSALLAHRFTVAFMCFHVPTDMFMSCARSTNHKPLGLYPHQLCETISFSSSVMNISTEYFQVTGVVSTASFRSQFQFLGCAAVTGPADPAVLSHCLYPLGQAVQEECLSLNMKACHLPNHTVSHLQQHCCDNLKSLLHNVL